MNRRQAQGVIVGLAASWVKAQSEPPLQGPAASRGRGALAGLAIYAGTHGSLLPALAIQRPPWRLAPAAVLCESTSHVVFGTALEAVRRVVSARLGRSV